MIRQNPDNRRRDEGVLIDFLMGQCDDAQAEQVRRRLEREEDFRRLHDDISHALAALELARQDSPADLTARTVARYESSRGLEKLLAEQELKGAGRRSPMFSLKELVAIAAAILLIVTVFVPSVWRARARELQARCAVQTGQIGSALKRYAIASNGYLPHNPEASSRWLPSRTQPAVSNSKALFQLVRHDYVPVKVFVCPAAPERPRTFTIRVDARDFPDRMYISYSYQNTLGGRMLLLTDSRLVDVAKSLAIMADRNPLFDEAGRFRRERIGASSDNHNQRGQNVLYFDMHVEWQRTPMAGVENDDIFTVDGVTEYEGDEAPADPTDTFLVPAYGSSK